MIRKLILSGIFVLLIFEISRPIEIQAGNKNSLIKKFCIASLKSKLKDKNKQDIYEISHFTCECFVNKFKSGYSLKTSRIYCKEKTAEKYNL